MLNMKQKIVSYFTLKFITEQFIDTVSGKAVSLYMDKYGNEFLKDARWSFFAVPVKRKHQ